MAKNCFIIGADTFQELLIKVIETMIFADGAGATIRKQENQVVYYHINCILYL